MGLTPYVHLDVPLVGATVGDLVALTAADRHHLRRVLRLAVGADVEVADGVGSSATGTLEDDGVRLGSDVVTTSPSSPRITVVQALAKGRKLDDVVRQVTELGADRVVPIAAERSVVRLAGDRAHRAVDRWRAVARAASEQARRPHRPEVTGVVTIEQLRATVDDAVVLVAHPGAAVSLPAAAPVDGAHLAVAVGPEGGWTDIEVETMCADAGGHPVGLGATVLRTEHAAAAAVAVLAALGGRWA